MEAREDPKLAQSVATLTKLTTTTVRRRLHSENGKTLLRNAFEDRWPGLIDELGSTPVSKVRDDDSLVGTIAGMLALADSDVRRKLGTPSAVRACARPSASSGSTR
jgi:hypothetical protein